MQVIQVSPWDAAIQHKLTSNADVITCRLESRLQSLNARVLHHLLPTRLDPKIIVQSPQIFEQAGTETDEENNANIIAYVGGESLKLTNVLMTHSHCEVNPHFRDFISALYNVFRCMHMILRLDRLAFNHRGLTSY